MPWPLKHPIPDQTESSKTNKRGRHTNMEVGIKILVSTSGLPLTHCMALGKSLTSSDSILSDENCEYYSQLTRKLSGLVQIISLNLELEYVCLLLRLHCHVMWDISCFGATEVCSENLNPLGIQDISPARQIFL